MGERNHLIDNCKALLIGLVVFGHLIEGVPRGGSTTWALTYTVIYGFHMPLFMLLSGLFVRTDGPSSCKAVLRLFGAYVTMAFLVTLSGYPASGTFGFRLIDPVWTAWYLEALLIMRALMPVISRIKYALPLLFAASLLLPLSASLSGGAFSLPRLVYFFPFFFIGYTLKLDGILNLRNKIGRMRWGVLALAVAAIAVLLYLRKAGMLNDAALRGASNYAELGYDPLWVGIPARACAICIALVISLAVICFMPQKHTPLTYIGKYSLSVYILQAVIITLAKPYLALPDITPFVYGLLCIPASVGICALTAAKPVFTVLDYPGKLLAKLYDAAGEDTRR